MKNSILPKCPINQALYKTWTCLNWKLYDKYLFKNEIVDKCPSNFLPDYLNICRETCKDLCFSCKDIFSCNSRPDCKYVNNQCTGVSDCPKYEEYDPITKDCFCQDALLVRYHLYASKDLVALVIKLSVTKNARRKALRSITKAHS